MLLPLCVVQALHVLFRVSASLVVSFGCVVQVKFFEVSESELEKQRSAFSNGQLQIKIEEQGFSMR